MVADTTINQDAHIKPCAQLELSIAISICRTQCKNCASVWWTRATHHAAMHTAHIYSPPRFGFTSYTQNAYSKYTHCLMCAHGKMFSAHIKSKTNWKNGEIFKLHLRFSPPSSGIGRKIGSVYLCLRVFARAHCVCVCCSAGAGAAAGRSRTHTLNVVQPVKSVAVPARYHPCFFFISSHDVQSRTYTEYGNTSICYNMLWLHTIFVFLEQRIAATDSGGCDATTSIQYIPA